MDNLAIDTKSDPLNGLALTLTVVDRLCSSIQVESDARFGDRGCRIYWFDSK